MMRGLGILGGGSFGSALAVALARPGETVRMWMRSHESAALFNQTHKNQAYTGDFAFPAQIIASDSLQEACEQSEYLIYTAPSTELESVLLRIKSFQLKKNFYFIDASKGLDPKTAEFHHEIAQRVLGPKRSRESFLVLSGPSFASEILEGIPTCITLAALDKKLTETVQPRLNTPLFRVYRHDDLVACELGGAMKNVIAIAVGMAEGLKLGHNTRAAVVNRGLFEIARLGLKLGARLESFMGLAVMGDLVLTCTANLSRNRRFGLALGEGLSTEEAKTRVGQTIEGIKAAQALHLLSRRHGVELPICEQVHAVLHEAKPVRDALHTLIARPVGDEWRG